MYSRLTLLFLFFPINQGEKIQAIAVRQIPDLQFPTNTPVIQVSLDLTLVLGAMTKSPRLPRIKAERIPLDHTRRTRAFMNMSVCALSLMMLFRGYFTSLPVVVFLLAYRTSEYLHRADVIESRRSISLREKICLVHHSPVQIKAGVTAKLNSRST